MSPPTSVSRYPIYASRSPSAEQTNFPFMTTVTQSYSAQPTHLYSENYYNMNPQPSHTHAIYDDHATQDATAYSSIPHPDAEYPEYLSYETDRIHQGHQRYRRPLQAPNLLSQQIISQDSSYIETTSNNTYANGARRTDEDTTIVETRHSNEHFSPERKSSVRNKKMYVDRVFSCDK